LGYWGGLATLSQGNPGAVNGQKQGRLPIELEVSKSMECATVGWAAGRASGL